MSASPAVRSLAALVALLSGAWLAVACNTDTGPDLSGVPPCGSSTLLTTSPIAYASIREVAPLGNLNPPGHVFPSDHGGFYIVSGPAAPLVSPGEVRVTQVLLQKRTGGGQPELDDYGLDFYPCTDQHFWFAHITSLSASFQSLIGTLDQSCNAPYQTGGFTYTQCRKGLSVDLTAGQSIGTAGGPTEGGLDLGLADGAMAPLAWVDPARQTGEAGLYAACAVDYFVVSVRDSLRAHIAVNGTPRTASPVCGTVMQDVPNTAQGRWFFDVSTHEDAHLALVHTSGDPAIGAFSIGTSQTGTTPTVLIFTPAGSGRLNLDFNLVTADGNIYCYTFTNSTSRVFVQLVTASQVKVELNGTGACGAPASWAFTGNAVTYSR